MRVYENVVVAPDEIEIGFGKAPVVAGKDVCVAVAVEVAVALLVPVTVAVSVRVNVADSVPVTVAVSEAVDVALAVAVSVRVGLSVGVGVHVGDTVCVADGVGLVTTLLQTGPTTNDDGAQFPQLIVALLQTESPLLTEAFTVTANWIVTDPPGITLPTETETRADVQLDTDPWVVEHEPPTIVVRESGVSNTVTPLAVVPPSLATTIV